MTEFPDFKQMLADNIKKFDVSVGLGTTPLKPDKRPTQPILERSKASSYAIRRCTLPPGEVKWVVMNIETLEAAKWEQRRLCLKTDDGRLRAKPYLWKDIDGDTVKTYRKNRGLIPIAWYMYDIKHQDNEGGDIYKNDVPILKEI